MSPSPKATPRPAVSSGTAARSVRWSVLRLVDHVRVRVHGHGFVGEPAEELQRLRVQVVVWLVRVDLEHVAVPLKQAVGRVRHVLGLFAAEPGVPGCLAAGAVDEGAGEADVLPHPVAVLVDLEGCGAAECAPGVIGQAVQVRHGRADWGVDLVVDHQHRAVPAVANEACRAVSAVRRRFTTVEPRHVGLCQQLVGEPRGQRQQPRRVGHQRPVAGHRVRRSVAARRGGPEHRPDAAGQRDPQPSCRAPAEERPPGQIVVGRACFVHHRLPPTAGPTANWWASGAPPMHSPWGRVQISASMRFRLQRTISLPLPKTSTRP